VKRLFDTIFLETPDKRDDFPLLRLRHLKLRQRCGGVPEEYVPVTLLLRMPL
jgi:hypothetical protein